MEWYHNAPRCVSWLLHIIDWISIRGVSYKWCREAASFLGQRGGGKIMTCFSCHSMFNVVANVSTEMGLVLGVIALGYLSFLSASPFPYWTTSRLITYRKEMENSYRYLMSSKTNVDSFVGFVLSYQRMLDVWCCFRPSQFLLRVFVWVHHHWY